MLRRYPKTLRWRQILPPLFVLALLSLGVLSLVWNLARWLLAIIVILYTIIIFGIGIQMSLKHKDFSYAIGVPLATATIHLSWGAAFLWGLMVKPRVNRAIEMIAAKTTPTSAKWRLRPRERRTLLLLVDFLMAVIAMFIAIYVWSVADIYQSMSLDFIRQPTYLVFPASIYLAFTDGTPLR